MPGIDSYTKLMLHMDGADGSTTFTDSSLSPKTPTATSALIKTDQYVFGGASGYFSAAHVSVADSDDWDFGTGDYTIDFRVRCSNWATGHRCMMELGAYGSNGILIQRNTTGSLFYGQSGSLPSKAWSPSNDTWYHMAFVRQGRYVYWYIDGVLFHTFDFGSTQNLSAGTNGVRIGNGFGGNNFLGWIDEFRISKGIARWTTNFTPPTSAYSDDSAVNNRKNMLLLGVG